MTELRLPYRSNPGAYKLLGSPRLINAYAEQTGDDNKAPYVLLPCSGLTALGSDVSGKCRGMIWLEEDTKLYAVFGYFAYDVASDGTKTQLGFVGGTGPVSIARNDAATTQVVIVTGGYAYLLESGSLVIKEYTDGSGNVLFTPLGVTSCGGYFVFWEGDGTFWASALNATTVDALSFATAEADPDGLTAAFGQANTLYLIGTVSTEIWTVSGSGDFPFEKVQGAHLRFGSLSPDTIVDFGESIVMVCEDNVVREITGYQNRAISSNEVSRLIEEETDKSALYAFSYKRGVNRFYCLQGTGWTREYNAATGTWHDRYSGLSDPWKAAYYARAFNKDVFGSRETGRTYEGDYTTFQEDGDPQIWGFDTETFHSFPNGLSFEKLSIDAETGDGISLTEDAYCMVRWSDDGGRTVKGEKRLSLGKTGEYGKRLHTQGGLGTCSPSGRMFKVRISDPVIRSIALIDAQVLPVEL